MSCSRTCASNLSWSLSDGCSRQRQRYRFNVLFHNPKCDEVIKVSGLSKNPPAVWCWPPEPCCTAFPRWIHSAWWSWRPRCSGATGASCRGRCVRSCLLEHDRVCYQAVKPQIATLKLGLISKPKCQAAARVSLSIKSSATQETCSVLTSMIVSAQTLKRMMTFYQLFSWF